ncbi:hypothetical protein [Actinomadura hibisca]|uniref:hypothetical protein n=1 Tax=Actinomadura hibisca TaxID=68565 RepID=UPI000AC3C6A5|nr:hypothetical protein [Actinomadura hibisca]
MNELEKRLHDALAGTAATVDEDVERPFPERPPRRERHRSFLVPLAAAFSVLLVLGAMVQMLGPIGGGKPDPQQRSGIPNFVLAAVPASKERPSRLEVRETANGRLVGAHDIFDRRWQFTQVAGRKNSRSFLVLAEKDDGGCAAKVFRIAVSESGDMGAPAQVTLAVPRNHMISELALSFDGAQLAYTTEQCDDTAVEGAETAAFLNVLTLSTGSARKWQVRKGALLGGLAWLPDGRRLLYISSGEVKASLRLLDTAGARASDLYAASRNVRELASEDSVSSLAVTPEGASAYLLVATLKGATGMSFEQGAGSRGQGHTELSPPGSATGGDSGGLRIDRIDLMTGAWRRSVFAVNGNDLGRGLAVDASGKYLLTFTSVYDLRRSGEVAVKMKFPAAHDLDW